MTVTVVTGDDCVTVVTGDDCVTVVTGDDGEVSAGSGRDEEEHDGEAAEAERRYLQLTPYLIPSETSYLIPNEISYLIPSEISYLIPSETSYLIPSYLIHRQCNKMSSM